jgi:hypothetical protein
MLVSGQHIVIEGECIMINRMHLLVLTIALSGLLAVTPSLADEVVDEIDNVNAKNCIRIRSLRSTKVVDDLNIIFYMIGSDTYHNILPRQCHGLKREGRFSYKSSTGSLCSQDTIRLLYQATVGEAGPATGSQAYSIARAGGNWQRQRRIGSATTDLINRASDSVFYRW